MKQYKLGVSPLGTGAVALVMLPNLLALWLAPPNDVLAGNSAAFWLWDVLENIGRFGLMASLIFLVPLAARQKSRWMDGLALLCLLAYYGLWAAYYLGAAAGLLLFGLALFPSLFFLLAALRLKNYIAAGFSGLFALTHMGITAANFLF